MAIPAAQTLAAQRWADATRNDRTRQHDRLRRAGVHFGMRNGTDGGAAGKSAWQDPYAHVELAVRSAALDEADGHHPHAWRELSSYDVLVASHRVDAAGVVGQGDDNRAAVRANHDQHGRASVPRPVWDTEIPSDDEYDGVPAGNDRGATDACARFFPQCTKRGDVALYTHDTDVLAILQNPCRRYRAPFHRSRFVTDRRSDHAQRPPDYRRNAALEFNLWREATQPTSLEALDGSKPEATLQVLVNLLYLASVGARHPDASPLFAVFYHNCAALAKAGVLQVSWQFLGWMRTMAPVMADPAVRFQPTGRRLRAGHAFGAGTSAEASDAAWTFELFHNTAPYVALLVRLLGFMQHFPSQFGYVELAPPPTGPTNAPAARRSRAIVTRERSSHNPRWSLWRAFDAGDPAADTQPAVRASLTALREGPPRDWVSKDVVEHTHDLLTEVEPVV